jgi:Zn-dependent protease
MFGSLKLGKFFGIDLYVHGTFWLLPLLVLFLNFGSGYGEIAFELLFVFAVFACVALHEVGHALAAAAYGIRTRDITLYPIGGVASLERMPEKPWQEVAVALAGPAVNVVIALGLLLGVLGGALLLPWDSGWVGGTADVLLARLFWANLFLCGFNLLPAFPMDGGRVLRALLATRMTRLRATEVAVKVGTLVAIGFVFAGIAWGIYSLLLIAVVVWLLGQAELGAIRLEAARRELERRARLFFGPPVAPVPEVEAIPADTAADLAARRFSGLAWDSDRGVWVQWVDGVPVRDIPA